jgi:hypothetical protein
MFGPTAKGKLYLSMDQHRDFAVATRNRWHRGCTRPQEFAIFGDADDNDWYDARPHLWGLLAGLAVLGCDGERIALFRAPVNDPDPWHGYPVSATDHRREFEHRPQPALVKRWVQAGLIDEFDAARINRGRI